LIMYASRIDAVLFCPFFQIDTGEMFFMFF
jgi:hypothetical protein